MSINEKTYRSLQINNMICDCCVKLLHLLLEKDGVEVVAAKAGELRIAYDNRQVSFYDIEKIINKNGFYIIKEKEKELINHLKIAVIELVHYTTFNAMVRNSDFLVEKFCKSYQYLSALFSKHEGITLEKYIILQKIEKVKQLLFEEDLSLSEIAYMMGYSSVQYLSTQFKNVAGVSVTEFKKKPIKYMQSIDKVGQKG